MGGVTFHCIPNFIEWTHVLFPVLVMYDSCEHPGTSVSTTVEVISLG